MFHIVKQKNSNAYDMKGTFNYLFFKSLTRENDLHNMSRQNRNQSTVEQPTAQ